MISNAGASAGFASPYGSQQHKPVLNVSLQPQQIAAVNPSNVCTTLRNILMNFARKSTPNGPARGKGSMKRVPTSDAAFLAVGWTLDSGPEIIVELAKDPVGSRYVQFRYTHPASVTEKNFVANTLLADFKACAKHACGNYTVQCLLTESQGGHTPQALLCVLKDADTLATNVYGHRVLQRALDVADKAMWNKLVQAIVQDVAAYTTHQCAHNVVQKLLTICAEKRVIPPQVLEFLASNAANLASHPYGCRVLQKTLEVMPQSWLSKTIFPSLLPLALTLANNPYGNFVLQKMIPAEAELIFAQFHGNIVQSSQHKYASNVLESLVSEAPEVCAASIVSEVIGTPIPTVSPSDATDAASIANYVHVSGYWLAHPAIARAGPVRQLLIDRYANYVLQKTLSTAPVSTRVVLADAVRVNADQIEGLPYGRQMLQEAIAVLISVGIMVPVQESDPGYSAHTSAHSTGNYTGMVARQSQSPHAAHLSHTSTGSGMGENFSGHAHAAGPVGVSSLSFQSGGSWMSPWDTSAHSTTLQSLGAAGGMSDYTRDAHSTVGGLQSLASAASDPASSSAHEAAARQNLS